MINGKNKDIPQYKKIYVEIVNDIINLKLLENEKLPPERELANKLGVSRGTVKKTYEMLVREGYAKAVQGSGTFICCKDCNVNAIDSIEKATEEIDKLIENMNKSGFSVEEIYFLFKERILNNNQIAKKVKFAAIDCNKETLSIIKNQLLCFNDLSFSEFLLEDILSCVYPEIVLGDFDIIFTTTTHSNELIKIIDNLKEKVIKAVMSPDIKTISDLTTIDDFKNTGVLTKSSRFGQIIKSNMNYFNIEIPEKNYCLIDNVSVNELKQFLSDKKAIVIPPPFALATSTEKNIEINKFGSIGKVINFNYIIERGSIIYIEENIRKIV